MDVASTIAVDVAHAQIHMAEKRANTVLLMQILLSLMVSTFCIVMLSIDRVNADGSNNTTLYCSLLSWTLGWWVSSPLVGKPAAAAANGGSGGGGGHTGLPSLTSSGRRVLPHRAPPPPPPLAITPRPRCDDDNDDDDDSGGGDGNVVTQAVVCAGVSHVHDVTAAEPPDIETGMLSRYPPDIETGWLSK